MHSSKHLESELLGQQDEHSALTTALEILGDFSQEPGALPADSQAESGDRFSAQTDLWYPRANLTEVHPQLKAEGCSHAESSQALCRPVSVSAAVTVPVLISSLSGLSALDLPLFRTLGAPKYHVCLSSPSDTPGATERPAAAPRSAPPARTFQQRQRSPPSKGIPAEHRAEKQPR